MFEAREMIHGSTTEGKEKGVPMKGPCSGEEKKPKCDHGKRNAGQSIGDTKPKAAVSSGPRWGQQREGGKKVREKKAWEGRRVCKWS